MTVGQRKQMLDGVMRPALKLLGGAEADSIEGVRLHSHPYGPLVRAYQEGVSIPKIEMPGVEQDPKLLTITLREAPYDQVRNSNVADWIQFGNNRREEGWRVVFVRDTAKADEHIDGFETAPDASRDLFARARLYQSAYCNLMLSNGPASLCIFSDNPFIFFVPLDVIPDYGPATTSWWQATAFITPPEQLPWLTDGQWIEWGKMDSLHNIESSWLAWKARYKLEQWVA